jgi:hypothetical protein
MSGVQASEGSANAHMKMSAEACSRMRATEKAILRYYNDMGKNKGNCTWGAGILAHKGFATKKSLHARSHSERRHGIRP